MRILLQFSDKTTYITQKTHCDDSHSLLWGLTGTWKVTSDKWFHKCDWTFWHFSGSTKQSKTCISQRFFFEQRNIFLGCILGGTFFLSQKNSIWSFRCVTVTLRDVRYGILRNVCLQTYNIVSYPITGIMLEHLCLCLWMIKLTGQDGL